MKKKYLLFTSLFIITTFFIWFSNWLFFQYQFPPGDDPVVHLNFIDKIIQSSEISLSYPPGLHLLISSLHLITQLPLNTIFIFLPIFLLGTMTPLTLFLITKKIGGLKKTIWAAPFYVCLLPIAAEIYSHGQFTEIVAMFLVLNLVLMILLNKQALSILLFGAIFLIHHLTVIPVLAAFIIFKIFQNYKKALLNLGFIFLITVIFLKTLPSYSGMFKRYSELIFSQLLKTNYLINPLEFSIIWRTNYFYLFLVSIGIILGVYYLIKKKDKFWLFILAWFLGLIFFSRFDYGDHDFSVRMIRQSLFPGIILAISGWLFLMSFCSKKIKIILTSLFLIIYLALLMQNISVIYPANRYQRIRPGDEQICNYLKTNTPEDTKILMAGKAANWHAYLSKRTFLMTERPKATVYPHNLYWDILDGNPVDIKTIDSLGIDYIYQVSPSTFFDVPFDKLLFFEDKLLASGSWELVMETEDARLFRYKY